MGKTTDAFTLKLQTLSTRSSDLTSDLLTACQEVAKANEKWAALEKMHNDRTLQIQAEHGNQASEYEPVVQTDALLIKIGDKLDKCGHTFLTKSAERTKAKKELATVTDELDDATAKFKVYVDKKEASKNPFKSKKSLPTAKELLKCARELIAKNEAVLK